MNRLTVAELKQVNKDFLFFFFCNKLKPTQPYKNIHTFWIFFLIICVIGTTNFSILLLDFFLSDEIVNNANAFCHIAIKLEYVF